MTRSFIGMVLWHFPTHYLLSVPCYLISPSFVINWSSRHSKDQISFLQLPGCLLYCTLHITVPFLSMTQHKSNQFGIYNSKWIVHLETISLQHYHGIRQRWLRNTLTSMVDEAWNFSFDNTMYLHFRKGRYNIDWVLRMWKPTNMT